MKEIRTKCYKTEVCQKESWNSSYNRRRDRQVKELQRAFPDSRNCEGIVSHGIFSLVPFLLQKYAEHISHSIFLSFRQCIIYITLFWLWSMFLLKSLQELDIPGQNHLLRMSLEQKLHFTCIFLACCKVLNYNRLETFVILYSFNER